VALLRANVRWHSLHIGHAVIIFLDTEFTDLVIQPRLLSVGIVAGYGSNGEFYAEVTDRDRIHAASWFALDAVLPQFGQIAHAACSYADLGTRLADFLRGLTATLEKGEFIEVAFAYHLDWEFVELAIKDSGAKHWESTRRSLRPVNVFDITGFGSGKLATEAYFKSQIQAPFSRHHSLCDARALRLAYKAAVCSGTNANRLPLRPHDEGSSRIWPSGETQRHTAA
jgi:hypothetical protein